MSIENETPGKQIRGVKRFIKGPTCIVYDNICGTSPENKTIKKVPSNNYVMHSNSDIKIATVTPVSLMPTKKRYDDDPQKNEAGNFQNKMEQTPQKRNFQTSHHASRHSMYEMRLANSQNVKDLFATKNSTGKNSSGPGNSITNYSRNDSGRPNRKKFIDFVSSTPNNGKKICEELSQKLFRKKIGKGSITSDQFFHFQKNVDKNLMKIENFDSSQNYYILNKDNKKLNKNLDNFVSKDSLLQIKNEIKNSSNFGAESGINPNTKKNNSKECYYKRDGSRPTTSDNVFGDNHTGCDTNSKRIMTGIASNKPGVKISGISLYNSNKGWQSDDDSNNDGNYKETGTKQTRLARHFHLQRNNNNNVTDSPMPTNPQTQLVDRNFQNPATLIDNFQKNNENSGKKIQDVKINNIGMIVNNKAFNIKTKPKTSYQKRNVSYEVEFLDEVEKEKMLAINSFNMSKVIGVSILNQKKPNDKDNYSNNKILISNDSIKPIESPKTNNKTTDTPEDKKNSLQIRQQKSPIKSDKFFKELCKTPNNPTTNIDNYYKLNNDQCWKTGNNQNLQVNKKNYIVKNSIFNNQNFDRTNGIENLEFIGENIKEFRNCNKTKNLYVTNFFPDQTPVSMSIYNQQEIGGNITKGLGNLNETSDCIKGNFIYQQYKQTDDEHLPDRKRAQSSLQGNHSEKKIKNNKDNILIKGLACTKKKPPKKEIHNNHQNYCSGYKIRDNINVYKRKDVMSKEGLLEIQTAMGPGNKLQASKSLSTNIKIDTKYIDWNSFLHIKKENDKGGVPGTIKKNNDNGGVVGTIKKNNAKGGFAGSGGFGGNRYGNGNKFGGNRGKPIGRGVGDQSPPKKFDTDEFRGWDAESQRETSVITMC